MDTHIIGTLWCLVDSHNGGGTEEVGGHPDRPANLYCVCTVKTSGRVIPKLERSCTECRFGNGHAFPLAPGHSSDEVVSYSGIDCVTNAKGCHDDISRYLAYSCRPILPGICLGALA